METIKDLCERYKGEYVEVEVFRARNGGSRQCPFHTDYCKCIDDIEDYSEDALAKYHELMNEHDYNTSILVNNGYQLDFQELYGDSEAKVLCIMLADE